MSDDPQFSPSPPRQELDPEHFGIDPAAAAARSEGRPGGPVPNQPTLSATVDPVASLVFRTPLREYSPAADTKAGGILTASGLMFTLLARYDVRIGRMLSGSNLEKWVVIVLLGTFAVLAIAAILRAFRTIAPRFPKAPPSLAFFGDIARLTREEYQLSVRSLSHEEAVEQMLRYNHTLSLICVAKFRELGRAIKVFERAFAVWLVLMILLNFRTFF